jgi:hypothetical protein
MRPIARVPAVCLLVLLVAAAGAAADPPPPPQPAAWTPEMRQELLGKVEAELKTNENYASWNGGWALAFTIGAVVINMLIAICTTSSNSTLLENTRWKNVLLYGSAVGAVIAATVVSLPELTGVGKLRVVQTQNIVDLKTLQININMNMITPEAARNEYVRILKRNPVLPAPQ